MFESERAVVNENSEVDTGREEKRSQTKIHEPNSQQIATKLASVI